MKSLLFVRHGETDMNADGRFAGRMEAILTAKGRLQAQRTGITLHDEHDTIDLMVCSPSLRTVETAEVIAQELGYPIKDIVKNELLLERTFGILEGTPIKEFLGTRAYKELDGVEGCETIEALQKRAARAYEWLHTLEHDNILVVGHGAFGRAILRVAHDQPHTDAYRVYVPVENAAILKLHPTET